MKTEGISLGWNCSAAQDGLKLGLRNTKSNGYKTCPFDMMITNYVGMCKCIEDDFKYFCDPNYLELRKAPKMSPHIPNQKDDEMWVFNSYYNFYFNHESPYHGNLYLNEQWSGPNHFVNNNFEKFVERYERRINNFRGYMTGLELVNFIVWRYNAIPYELVDIIKEKYPNLNFKVNTIIDFGRHTVDCLITNTPEASKEYEMDYLRYMNITENEYPEEFSRYRNELITKDIKNDEHIILIYPTKISSLN